MTDDSRDAVFAGSVPEIYEQYLVPLIFEGYAEDLADRAATETPESVLEVAAGTGVVTRALSARLDTSVRITATDLNADMIRHAEAVGTSRPVEWREADVMRLPFDDGEFDVVVCQFSAMFFPDRPAAYQEVNRVLRPGGVFIFNVWDDITRNEFAHVVTDAVGELFPNDPPRFLPRTPHGYHDAEMIRGDLRSAGFTSRIPIDVLRHRSVATSPNIPAIAYCKGTPLRNEIEHRDPNRLDEATDHAAKRLSERFGSTNLDGEICGLVIVAST